MSEQKKKVIIVSNKVNEKITDELRARLEAHGIDVEVKDKETMTKEEAQEIEVMFKCKEPSLSAVSDEMIRMAAENAEILDDPVEYNKKPKKYVPKKIGEESKAKVKNIRGKRYGR
jgi:glycine cleavage system pyridoxal-binding protein P